MQEQEHWNNVDKRRHHVAFTVALIGQGTDSAQAFSEAKELNKELFDLYPTDETRVEDFPKPAKSYNEPLTDDQYQGNDTGERRTWVAPDGTTYYECEQCKKCKVKNSSFKKCFPCGTKK